MHSSADLSILILGNVTRDIPCADPAHAEYVLGGSVSYAALTCHRLQAKAEVVTRASADMDLAPLTAVARCTVLPSATTTTFVNSYGPQGRVQHCYHPAAPIRAADLTPAMRQARAVFMCPIMQEVAADVPPCFGDSAFQAAGLQGWLRGIDAAGCVHPVAWRNQENILRCLDVAILSREDIDHDLNRLYAMLEHVPLAILSNYRHGCDIFERRAGGVIQRHVPPRPAREVDPTGAGDVFATAFLIRFLETDDVWQAARFANVAASFGVEGAGAAAIPSRQAVLQYLAAHPV